MKYSQDYTVKSNARRAARKAGVEPSAITVFMKAGKKLYRFPLPPETAAPKPSAPKAAVKAKRQPKATKAKVAKPAKTKTATPAKRQGKPNAGGGKFDQVAALLRRPGGASMTELVAITSWQPHSARARISVDVSKLLGKGEVIERRREDGVSHYAIVNSKQQDLPLGDAA